MSKRVSVRVPIRTQPDGVGWCVPAAVQMVFAYHGDYIDLRDIALAMGVPKRVGIDVFKASLYLLRCGYRVRLVLWDDTFPASFSKTRGPLTEDQFMIWAHRRTRQPSWIRSSGSRYGREFFRFGGKIVARPASRTHIRAALRRKQPPVLIVNIATLWKVNRRDATHAVVPVQLTESHITVNDPAGTIRRARYPLDVFLHAFYRAEGQMIQIRPPKR